VNTEPSPHHRSALPKGFHVLIGAQFTSALADNALLIVAVALLRERDFPAWWAPLLKFVFTLSYVFLAPWVGPIADAIPKARLMAWMNGLKWFGAAAMLLLWNPIVGFAIVGVGAAAYAPAKYGLITELVPAHQLVKANGWIEVSVVSAALLGVAAGGFLVSERWLAFTSGGPSFLGTSQYGSSVCLILLLYTLASLLNWRIPDSGAIYPSTPWHPIPLLKEFWQGHLKLWSDPEGRLSLGVTTLFWGVAATLQFAVLRWADEILGLTLDKAAYLQGVVALGIVAGAALAGRWVPLHWARRILPLGVVMGICLPVATSMTNLSSTLWVLCLLGAVCGMLVVPMNALLQHRGYVLLSAGRSIAVQGFNENASILVMLGVYAACTKLQVPIVPLMTAFGWLIALAMAGLTWMDAVDRKRSPRL
jgi:LPLT family lysophospholipid transporter-like MFS transporter